MILESIFNLIFGLIEMIVSLFPDLPDLPNFMAETISLLSVPLGLFPLDLWVVIISNLFFWFGASFLWSIVEWVYKKLPGVS